MLTTKLVLERLDKDGRLIEKREQQSRSFVIQFFQFLQGIHDNLEVNIPDITNTARAASTSGDSQLNIASPGGWGGMHGHFTRTLYALEGEIIGIQVGTGVGAPAPTDYALGTRITHGSGAGQFIYGGNEIHPIIIAAPSASFIIRRYFTNLSGGSITVNEVGIYALIQYWDGSNFRDFAACILHDAVSPGVAVANNELLRVTYVPQIKV